MIGDSVPWKEDLLRIAKSLERRRLQRRWSERTSFLVEREVMSGAYAVRKLSESRKISDELAAETVAAQRHALIGRPVDIWNRHEFYEHYDMNHPQSVRLSLTEFCNQVIHSWVWMISATEKQPHGFDGIYVSSDRARKRHVYFIGADSMVRLFRAVALDDIVAMQMQRDANGDMHILRASREHPAGAELFGRAREGRESGVARAVHVMRRAGTSRLWAAMAHKVLGRPTGQFSGPER